MSAKNFLQLVGVIFGVIGVLHLLRLFFDWQIILVGWEVPIWLSYFGVIIAWVLAYTAFSFAEKAKYKK